MAGVAAALNMMHPTPPAHPQSAGPSGGSSIVRHRAGAATPRPPRGTTRTTNPLEPEYEYPSSGTGLLDRFLDPAREPAPRPGHRGQVQRRALDVTDIGAVPKSHHARWRTRDHIGVNDIEGASARPARRFIRATNDVADINGKAQARQAEPRNPLAPLYVVSNASVVESNVFPPASRRRSLPIDPGAASADDTGPDGTDGGGGDGIVEIGVVTEAFRRRHRARMRSRGRHDGALRGSLDAESPPRRRRRQRLERTADLEAGGDVAGSDVAVVASPPRRSSHRSINPMSPDYTFLDGRKATDFDVRGYATSIAMDGHRSGKEGKAWRPSKRRLKGWEPSGTWFLPVHLQPRQRSTVRSEAKRRAREARRRAAQKRGHWRVFPDESSAEASGGANGGGGLASRRRVGPVSADAQAEADRHRGAHKVLRPTTAPTLSNPRNLRASASRFEREPTELYPVDGPELLWRKPPRPPSSGGRLATERGSARRSRRGRSAHGRRRSSLASDHELGGNRRPVTRDKEWLLSAKRHKEARRAERVPPSTLKLRAQRAAAELDAEIAAVRALR